jgi:hypothetical protein
MLNLRDYQHEAITAVLAAKQRGIHRPVVTLPTNTGKEGGKDHLLAQRGVDGQLAWETTRGRAAGGEGDFLSAH